MSQFLGVGSLVETIELLKGKIDWLEKVNQVIGNQLKVSTKVLICFLNFKHDIRGNQF